MVIVLRNNIKTKTMTDQKQFGVWMDTKHATIVGSDNTGNGNLAVLANITVEEVTPGSSNKNLNNQKTMLQAKFFKEISSYLENATYIHVTGTGQAQEQFIHYLADTPKFKKTKAEDSTANRMSEERLIEFFEGKFN
jgi:phage FluMu gp28-like protein